MAALDLLGTQQQTVKDKLVKKDEHRVGDGDRTRAKRSENIICNLLETQNELLKLNHSDHRNSVFNHRDCN